MAIEVAETSIFALVEVQGIEISESSIFGLAEVLGIEISESSIFALAEDTPPAVSGGKNQPMLGTF